MPYYIHTKTSSAPFAVTVGEPFSSRVDAYTVMQTLDAPTHHTVSFFPSSDEFRNWRRREWQRFRDGVYILPPWFKSCAAFWEPSDPVDYRYPKPELTHHFAHISLKQPGQIAYTPSDEHGIQDRQVSTTTARYLERYASSYFTAAQIADYVAKVKTYTGELHIVTSAGDIIRVYIGGPHSCMSGKVEDYQTNGIHPCAVYGDSDIALAYLGDIDSASARCLIWPEKKWFSRVYGDSCLSNILLCNGYVKAPGSSYGDFSGATIRKIVIPDDCNAYVLPYLDMASGVRDMGDSFRLCRGSADYDGDSTDGTTRPRNTCEHCGDACGGDEDYCADCEDNRFFCEGCEEDYFHSDGGTTIGNYTYCNTCASSRQRDCNSCGRTYAPEELEEAGLEGYCNRCILHYSVCEGCSSEYDTRNGHATSDLCDDCQPEDTPEETDEPTATTTEGTRTC